MEKGGGRGPTFCILNTGYQIGLCEGGDGSVGAAPGLEMGELDDEGCRDDFVVFTALLHLFELHGLEFWIFWIGCCWERVVSGTYGGKDAPVFRG